MTDETQPVRPEGAPADQPATTESPTGTPVAPAGPEGRRGLRERVRRLRTSSDGSRAFGLAALIASALAGVIVGGLGATAVHAITHDRDGRPDWSHRQGPMGRGFGDDGPGGPGGTHDGPRGVPGQLPPTTAPEDDSPDPDSGGSSS
jgi:hypothetical protein